MLRAGLALLFLPGCTPVEGGRQDVLVEQLVLDNQRWLSRDRTLLEAKFRRMAADPYDFMRAMATVDLADWTRPGADRQPTAFLTVRGTESTLLAGDPHPENVGVHRPGPGPLLVEINDLDGATFGPYLWDVRRGMTGLGVLLGEAGCRDACLSEGLTRYAETYAETLLAGAAGQHSGYGSHTAAPVLLRDLLDEATEDGLARDALHSLTRRGTDGRRAFVHTGLVDDVGDLAPTAEERAQLARLVPQVERRHGVRVLDVVRRYGRGVASLPALRYALLVDEGAEGDADDRLLQLREVLDPLPFPGWREELEGSFADNGDRVVQCSRLLWSRPDADPDLDAFQDGAQSFKLTTLSGWFEGFEHDRILDRVADGRFDEADLLELSGWLGGQLATVHDRAPTREGADAGPAIRADLEGRVDLFVTERVEDAERAIQQTRRDHTLFLGALQRLGPDLGAFGVPR